MKKVTLKLEKYEPGKSCDDPPVPMYRQQPVNENDPESELVSLLGLQEVNLIIPRKMTLEYSSTCSKMGHPTEIDVVYN